MKKIYQILQNISLNIKIFFIVLIVSLLGLISSFIALHFIEHSYHQLLYQVLAGSLSYSADDISKKLSNIESMTSAIVSNSNIRKNLITLRDKHSKIQIYNAKNSLERLITDYYQTYKNNNISYINLYTKNFTISSHDILSSLIPEHFHQYVRKCSEQNSGYPIWVHDACNTYGLFLGRDCRRVKKLNFQTLGTVVVNIDMDKLIQSSTKSILYSKNAQYILYENENIFYHSPTLSKKNVSLIRSKLQANYCVMNTNSGKLFVVQGNITNSNWKYICLIPYKPIEKTLFYTKIIALSVIIISVLLALFFSKMLIHSITIDFHNLIHKIKKFGNDTIETNVIKSDYINRTDEIGILHNQFDQMTNKIKTLIQENYVQELLSKEAQIKALENQINPHFLYNTLESVNWRAKAIGAKDISAMVESLGTLLRETLSAKERNFTLYKELEIVQNYITIQKIRFEDRLIFSEEIDKSLHNVLLPHLTLQPLVENAINYGLEENTDICHIHITSSLIKDKIYIDVMNDNSQFDTNLLENLENGTVIPHGFGIGLLNIHKRIQLTYGIEYGLTVFNADDNIAVARIVIPRRKLC